jgi:hypothetical protein
MVTGKLILGNLQNQRFAGSFLYRVPPQAYASTLLVLLSRVFDHHNIIKLLTIINVNKS